ncbi:DUF4190 domain-containing protein [Spirillospora sp. NBC_01491]|uniref:DUF4190 domain-containing protein n=1 Tax=Spirillospora sp. NBC_01491 TaxID=2976007 RepID=UPI002E301E5F|nr:septum formation family protein [Spirillospora sp. NBC_01491]
MTVPPNADNLPASSSAPDWAAPDAPSTPDPPSAPPAPPAPPAQDGPPHAGRPVPSHAVQDAAARTNRFAIVALVTAIIGGTVIAIGFGIAALVQIGRRGERGKGLAIGGIVAGTVWLPLVVAGLALVAYDSARNMDRNGSGDITKSGQTLIGMLKVGDCFDGSGKKSDRVVTARPCDERHHGEIVAKTRLPDGPFPGEQRVFTDAGAACDKVIGDGLAKSRYADDLVLSTIAPTGNLWKRGERGVTCAMRYSGEENLTSRLAGTVDPDLRTWPEVQVGDCMRNWDSNNSVTIRIMSCTKPHKHQVVGVHRFPAGTWPGVQEVRKKASADCVRRQAAAFDSHPSPVPVELLVAPPTKRGWSFGYRLAFCLVEGTSGPLKRSVLPD